MKHLMRYEGFSSQERLDEILDKISKYGIESISKEEKEFLDSHKHNKEEEFHKKLQFKENEIIFEDDNNYFSFEFKDLEKYDDELHIKGVLYVPDIEFEDDRKIKGRLEGTIVVFEGGDFTLDFYKETREKNKKVTYDIFEFIEGLEYEFDSFIDYVVSEIEKK